MARVLAFTPTLADAVQSIGGTLAQHAAQKHDVVLVTVFDEQTSIDTSSIVGDLLRLSGVITVDLPTTGHDAYDGTRAEHDELITATGAALALTLSKVDPTLVLSPLGLTGHTDARILNDALDALEVPRMRWLDLPYGVHRTPGAPLGAGEVVAVPITDQLGLKLAACELLDNGVDPIAIGDHAVAEGERLGAGVPVEVLLRPAGLDDGGDAAAVDGPGGA